MNSVRAYKMIFCCVRSMVYTTVDSMVQVLSITSYTRGVQ